MALTRDPDFPEEAAQLVALFNRCAGGHDILHVVEAAEQFLVLAYNHHAQATGGGLQGALELARPFGDRLDALIRFQWERQDQPSDVPVRSN